MHDKYLVQSFVGETRVLEISGGEAGADLAETEIDGFDHEAQVRDETCPPSTG